MALLLKPDTPRQERPATYPVIFLAGSIDEGRAEAWQNEIANALSHLDVTILNPRRDNWLANLRQDIEEPEFAYQVNWELDGIESADLVFFHFSPSGPAPITLLELGKAVAMKKQIILSCPPGYWRRGNVQVVCSRANITVHDDLISAQTALIDHLKNHVAGNPLQANGLDDFYKVQTADEKES